MFQMDYQRRIASGTLAELLGPAALPNDVQTRTIGIRRGAQASESAASPRMRDIVKAYTAGVNAYVSSHPLPPEYAALELTRFQPWTTTDSFAVAKLLAFGLSFDFDDPDYTIALLTYLGVGQVAGFDGSKLFSEDLFRSQPFDPASTVPDASAASGKAQLFSEIEGMTWSENAVKAASRLDRSAAEMARDWVDSLKEIRSLKDLIEEETRGASNEWAIAGSLTTTGNPMIANDPHLSLDMPSTFYPLSIRGPGLNAAGVGFPGAPLVVIGHTDGIAWGATWNPLDVTDYYAEQVVPDAASLTGFSFLYKGQQVAPIPLPQTWRANNLGNGTNDDISVIPPAGSSPPPAVVIVPHRNAPMIALDAATGAAVSVQWTGHGPTRELETFLIWNSAKNLSDFKNGLQYFDVGSQNWIYTDVDGNIAY
ncbi:MAG: penicillin acylase family protein, partial [Synechococcaceae cyanobacterium]|nr:penicillin acylase family protein [Synechococcaceae cyanobacterium]